jgi:DNA-binding SARP family transcriptional activator
MTTSITFRLLGIVEVESAAERLPLNGKQRSLLAALLVQANHTVTNGRLMDALWERPFPASPETRVRTLVSELRRAFALFQLAPIATRPSGYLLRVDPGQLDLDVFTDTVADATRALAAGRVQVAVCRYEQALALWQGPALGGASGPHAEVEATRLEEMRLSAQEGLFTALLRLGDPARVVADLAPLVRAHPLRESFHAQLMLALYRTGRRGEALDLYLRLHRRLVADLGMEPMPMVQRLHHGILSGTPDPEARPLPARCPG